MPILIGALGPKGRAVAEKHDGVFAATTVEGLEPGAFDWVAFLYWGTVLDQGESVDSERVRLSNQRLAAMLRLQSGSVATHCLEGVDHFGSHTGLRDPAHPWYQALAAHL